MIGARKGDIEETGGCDGWTYSYWSDSRGVEGGEG